MENFVLILTQAIVSAGYKIVGRHHLCGYKFGRWYSVVWMEKLIADRPEMPELFVPFVKINKEK